MIRLAFLFFILLAGAVSPVCAADTISIIPRPKTLQLNGGQGFPLSRAALVVPARADSKEIALFLAEAIREDYGIDLLKNRSAFSIRFLPFNPKMGAEAYRLDINTYTVNITAGGPAGMMWAVQSLRQLPRADGKRDMVIPCLLITDEPDFPFRSQMLDVGRHFFSPAFIKKHIDLLSFYKINTFHWHLTEDQGWRIEIKKFPELMRKAAWRTEPDGSRHGGYYTQEEIKEIVAYAAKRQVQIIPEIEMPGHCMAALSAYPMLSCTGKKLTVPNYWGVMKDVYCAGKDVTFYFLQDVLDEVVWLFPGRYVHIGGDEVPKDRWHACADCQRRIKQEGLQDEHDLQAYFVRRIQNYLKQKGKQLIGWDEILEGGVDKTALIEVWRGEDKARAALKNGNPIIGTLYLDGAPATLTLEKSFGMKMGVEGAKGLVLGADAPLWTEHVWEGNAEYMLYPRLLAFAEQLWHPNKDFSGFKERLAWHYRFLSAKGVAYGAEDKNLLNATLKFLPYTQSWKLYTETGREDIQLKLYSAVADGGTDSLYFRDSVTVAGAGSYSLSASLNGRTLLPAQNFVILKNGILGRQPVYNQPYHKNYARAGDYGLTDGIAGSMNFADGNWLGWWGNNLDVVVDLGALQAIRSLQLNCMQQSQSWILLPKKVEYFISEDGAVWNQLTTLKHTVGPDDFDPRIHPFRYELPVPVKARYIRALAHNFGKLPDWHNGAGGQAWIFADELLVQ